MDPPIPRERSRPVAEGFPLSSEPFDARGGKKKPMLFFLYLIYFIVVVRMGDGR